MDIEGVLLGEEVIRVMTNTPRMESNPVISAGQDIATCPGRRRLDKTLEGFPGTYEDGDPVHIRLGVLRDRRRGARLGGRCIVPSGSA